MTIQHNISLKNHSTMRLGGAARYACEVHTKQDVQKALAYAHGHSLQVIVVGSGSNIVWSDDDFNGLLIIMKIDGIQLLPNNKLRVGAGECWDDAVAYATDHNLYGIELLSLVPGTAGATPIQNVGAYGAEIKDSLAELEAYDTLEDHFVSLSASDCDFAYRSSRFKTTDRGRYVICSITLQLSSDPPRAPFYESLQAYLDTHNITDITPKVLRNAVIAVRRSKLPDPTTIANNGSFFANPVVTSEQFADIKTRHPTIKAWQLPDDTYKLAAGWLVEAAGFSDYHDQETGMATWPTQNLVIVNEHAKSTQDLQMFVQKITSAVHKDFNVVLQQEPELLP